MKFLDINVDNSLTRCNVCTGYFNLDKEGGVKGDIGILRVAFCPTCFAGVSDMCEQLCNHEEVE